MKKYFIIWFVFIGLLTFNIDNFAQDSTKAKNQQQIKTKVNNRKQTQKKHGRKFVDKDGDGYNDNAPDHDGDGIPNGLDDDYMGAGKNAFVDLDGDGINDNGKFGNGNGYGARNGFRSGNDLNTKTVGPQNGNATGSGNNGGNSSSSGKTRKGKGGRGN